MNCKPFLFCARYLSKAFAAISLSIGLYLYSKQANKTNIFLISFTAVSVIAIAAAFKFYYKFERACATIMNLWYGFLLGLVTFAVVENHEHSPMLYDLIKAFILLALIAEILWSFIERIVRSIKQELQLIHYSCIVESIGFCAASLVSRDTTQLISVLLVLTSLNITLTSVQMKSVRDAILFIVISLIWVQKSHLEPTIFLYFIGKSLGPLIFNIYSSPYSLFEHWQTYLFKNKMIHYAVVAVTLATGLSSVIVTAIVSFHHIRWYAVMIIFTVVAILWICFHLIYLITYWKFITKVATSIDHHRQLSSATPGQTLAAHGLRHFSLICHMITGVTIVTSVVIFAMSSAIQFYPSFEVGLVAFSLECFSLNMFADLSTTLGGTCTAYTIISPAYRLGQGVQFMPPLLLQESTSRASQILNVVQRFITTHALSNHGYEFSTGTLTSDNVRGKVSTFFRDRTDAGVRYDTYLLYYSGDVLDNGDWPLSDGGSISAEDIIGWWNGNNDESHSRLILILDTQNSHNWVKAIKSRKNTCVAIQTHKLKNPAGTEIKPEIGEFTHDWVRDNVDGDAKVDWSEEKRASLAVYAVSKNWFKFRLHEPTFEEIQQYWEGNFPRFTHAFVVLFKIHIRDKLCCVCRVAADFYEACCYSLIRQNQLDTGHGFKLVKS